VSENENVNESSASRRTVIGGFVGLGVGVPLLAACGSDGGGASSSGGGSSSSSGGTTSSGSIGKTSEVPVGGGKIFTADKVVVTQPTAGDFKAFSSICTHQGCPVTKISGEDIDCTCHGSKFSIKDGSVVNGPATKALESLTVKVTGEDITVS
jgi:nitrite reductase/ring-hydroxylating ferredoxin subunit